METGTLPIKYVIMNRRLNYLKHILSTSEHELIRKVYEAQKRRPTKNDWVLSVNADRKDINLSLSDEQICKISSKKFKKIVREKIRKSAFEYLISLKNSHSKVKEILYEKFKIQQYLTDSKLTMKQKSLLFKLRTKMLNVKANFSTFYQNSTHCDYCNSGEIQTQQHLLESCEKIISNCKSIFNNIDVDHEFIYGSIEQQIKVTKLYIDIEDIRDDFKMTEEDDLT